MPRANLVEKVLAATRADPILSGGGRVVVAFSGGPDSTALLHALTRARRALDLELTAAHLDHGMRTGSQADARAAAAVCAELEVALVSERLKRESRPKSEDAARRRRHAFLDRVARRTGAATIAYGHTADDQAETVLMHLIRGSGLDGIAAMAPRSGLRFRPLLGVWRSEVEAYCARHRLPVRHDPSNRELRYLRNRIRFEVLPHLEDLNPRVKESLIRLAGAARSEHHAVAGAAVAWLALHEETPDRPTFLKEQEAVQVEILRRLWSRAADGPLPGGAARIEQALSLLADARRRGMMDLGRGLKLRLDGDRFSIRP